MEPRNKWKGKASRASRSFALQRRLYLRLIGQIDDTVNAGSEILLQIPKHRIRGTVKAIKSYPLAHFGSEKRVQGLIEDVRAMCTEG